MAAVVIPKRRPWNAIPGVPAVQRGAALAKRYPVFPLAILVTLLFIPAITANWLAPHDHRVGDLDQVLIPPAWVGDSLTLKTVVNRVADNDTEVSLTNAKRNVKKGVSTVVGGAEGDVVKIGDQTARFRQGGSWVYPLGTDKLGRDILSRIMHGARISLLVSSLAIFIGGGLGTVLGLIAAYRGGLVDSIIMRVVDIKLAFPSILLALVLVAVFRPSLLTVVVVISVLLWARFARVVRGEAISIKQRDFIDRARVSGASNVRIMARHIFPNLVNTVVVLSTLEVGHVIILESTLSFLGAGIPRPTPAWGVMVADGRELITSAWWIFLFPTLAIVLTVLSMNLIGDWLRDKLDPKLRNV